MMMPDSARSTNFDLGKMCQRFEGENGRHLEGYATIEVDATSKGGAEKEVVPVPADLREVWQMLQKIELPEVS